MDLILIETLFKLTKNKASTYLENVQMYITSYEQPFSDETICSFLLFGMSGSPKHHKGPSIMALLMEVL